MESTNYLKNSGNSVVVMEGAVPADRKVSVSDMVLRLVATALCLVAAVVVGVDKQTAVVPITVVPTLPPLNVPLTAKWQHLSAFVYFVVANGVACSYAAISLLLQVTRRGGRKIGAAGGVEAMIITMDVVIVALLSSSVGAATAIGLVGYEGNSHVQWNKVCNVYDKFCHQFAAAAVVSLLASISFVLLVVLAALNLLRTYK